MPEWTPGPELDAELARLMGWKQHTQEPGTDWWNWWIKPNGRFSLLPAWSTEEAQVGPLLAWLSERFPMCSQWKSVSLYFASIAQPIPDPPITASHATLPGALALVAQKALAAMEASNATE